MATVTSTSSKRAESSTKSNSSLAGLVACRARPLLKIANVALARYPNLVCFGVLEFAKVRRDSAWAARLDDLLQFVRTKQLRRKRLVLHNGALSAADRKINQQLQGMIRAALSGENFPVSLAVQRPAKLPLIIRALCLDKGLLLIVLDPEASLAPPEDVLTQTFRLTPAEVEVTIGIASGKSLSEIAVERGVKVGTVRAHSRSYFRRRIRAVRPI